MDNEITDTYRPDIENCAYDSLDYAVRFTASRGAPPRHSDLHRIYAKKYSLHVFKAAMAEALERGLFEESKRPPIGKGRPARIMEPTLLGKAFVRNFDKSKKRRHRSPVPRALQFLQGPEGAQVLEFIVQDCLEKIGDQIVSQIVGKVEERLEGVNRRHGLVPDRPLDGPRILHPIPRNGDGRNG